MWACSPGEAICTPQSHSLLVEASCGNSLSPCILICVSRPRGWPWVTRAAVDPSCKESCLQSQHRCRLPLEKCEYPGEIHGADTLGHTLCPHRQQEPALLLVWNLAVMHYSKENSWNLQARSCVISNSSSLTGADLYRSGPTFLRNCWWWRGFFCLFVSLKTWSLSDKEHEV